MWFSYARRNISVVLRCGMDSQTYSWFFFSYVWCSLCELPTGSNLHTTHTHTHNGQSIGLGFRPMYDVRSLIHPHSHTYRSVTHIIEHESCAPIFVIPNHTHYENYILRIFQRFRNYARFSNRLSHSHNVSRMFRSVPYQPRQSDMARRHNNSTIIATY